MIAAVYLRMKEAPRQQKRKQGILHETKLTLLAGRADSSGYLGRGATRAGRRHQQTGRGKGRRYRAAKTEETMVVTAARQTLQAPGVSTLTADEIRKHPPARDISELIRTQPG